MLTTYSEIDAVSGASHRANETLRRLHAASVFGGAVEVQARLEGVQQWLADDLRDVALSLAALESELGQAGRSAQLAARHLLALPGKRIRPLCVLLAARLGGRHLDAVVRDLASASELVHAATLLHDDVIDEGAMRRGAPTARMVYGNSASVLGGDHLLVRALKLVQRTGVSTALVGLLSVIDEMVEAEAVQLSARHAPQIDRALVQRVIRGKTGALFRWSLEAGAQAAGMADAEIGALGEAGMAVGVAFQLIDDLLDLTGDRQTLGKEPLADLREGKITWPVLVAVEMQPALLPWVERAARDDGARSLEELASKVRASGAVQATLAQAHSEAQKARQALAILGDSESRRALEAVIDAVLARRM